MRRLSVFLLVLCPCLAASQAPASPGAPAQGPPSDQNAAPAKTQPAAPQLSPQAAYEEAKRPLDLTRAPYENWSEVEQNALDVSIKQAAASCSARDPYQFTGEDLIAYARLCFFGQEWQRVQLAAANYILAQQQATAAEKVTGFPSLSMAFDYSVQALLHLGDPISAKSTAETMLRNVPYDDMASEATGLVARYLQFTGSEEDALALLARRQPILLGLLKAQSAPAASAPPPMSPSPASEQTPRPALPIHALYADAVAYPALQQYCNQIAAAADSFAEVEATLPASLSPDDAVLTTQSRRQYLLLGAPLPQLAPFAWLLSPTFAVPHEFDTHFGAATVLFLFPDWCGCVGMGDLFSPASERLGKNSVRFYALLAQDKAPPPPLKPAAKPASTTVAKTAGRAIDPVAPVRKLTAAEYLAGTPTLVVPNEVLTTFVAADYPLIVAVDHGGIVRAIQVAPQNALQPGFLVDQIAGHVLKLWPPPAPK